MSLRIGFDASAAAVPQPTGVGLAISHLAEALRAEAPSADAHVEVLVRLSRIKRRKYFPPGATVFHDRISLLVARRLDVFHGPDARPARFHGPAQVATVHDLSARRSEFASARFRATREAHWARVRERADLVVTYTAAVKAEVARELEFPAQRIAVVPLAPTNVLTSPADEEVRAVTARVTAGRPYVLCLGELSNRKNTALAVEAFAAAGADLQRHALLLVGPRGYGAERVEEAIARHGLEDKVVRPSYLPAGEVACLLKGADALCFPSRYEGFGMPVLEAFRARVPVVASTAPSVVEVAGGAALHVDPDDAEGLGAALARVVRDADVREGLVRAGERRLRAFSWRRAAQGLLAVYRAAKDGQPAPTTTQLPSSSESPCSR